MSFPHSDLVALFSQFGKREYAECMGNFMIENVSKINLTETQIGRWMIRYAEIQSADADISRL